jgi:hypothetical protein
MTATAAESLGFILRSLREELERLREEVERLDALVTESLNRSYQQGVTDARKALTGHDDKAPSRGGAP